MRDLLGDADTAEFGISMLELDDRRDEFRGRTFGAGFAAMRGGGKEQAVFTIHQGLVELEQCCRLDERAKLRNPARAHEQRAQTEHPAIEPGQIRRTLPGSITDQELMFEQKRFCSDGTYTTWTEQPRERDQQVDGEDKEFAHGANRTMSASARKAARHRRIPSYYEFTTDRLPNCAAGAGPPLESPTGFRSPLCPSFCSLAFSHADPHKPQLLMLQRESCSAHNGPKACVVPGTCHLIIK